MYRDDEELSYPLAIQKALFYMRTTVAEFSKSEIRFMEKLLGHFEEDSPFTSVGEIYGKMSKEKYDLDKFYRYHRDLVHREYFFCTLSGIRSTFIKDLRNTRNNVEAIINSDESDIEA